MEKRIKMYLGLLPLFVAAVLGCNGSKEKVSAEKDRNNVVNTAQLTDKDTLIFKAALDGDINTVTEIITSGTDVNIVDREGRTALMYAAFNGNLEIAKLLIEKGADVNLTDLNKRTALMFAASGPYPETVNLLLEQQADPNMADLQEHFTALMYAAAEGQAEVVELLLKYKADPLIKDVDGDVALTFATNNGHTEVAKLLNPFSNSK